MKVLIVKMSSMGDIIHTFPSLNDVCAQHPDTEFHWLVEEAFQDIPRWHNNVSRVIPIRLRRWRKEKWRCFFNGEFKAFLNNLRKEHYDIVIDAQSSIKSAIITRLARGTRHGYSFKTTRERFASIFYQKKHRVIFEQHAIRRMRLLFSKVFNYPFEDNIPNFCINTNRLPAVTYPLPKKFVVFLHSTSWVTKQWPENYWKQMIRHCVDAGYDIVLPWGDKEEKARSGRLAFNENNVHVPPRVSISETASMMSKAQAVLACDTGLGHVAAALNIPCISLYGPTNPDLVRPLGKEQFYFKADFQCAPCMQKQCTYNGRSDEQPACFTTIPPQAVWTKFKTLL